MLHPSSLYKWLLHLKVNYTSAEYFYLLQLLSYVGKPCLLIGSEEMENTAKPVRSAPARDWGRILEGVEMMGSTQSIRLWGEDRWENNHVERYHIRSEIHAQALRDEGGRPRGMIVKIIRKDQGLTKDIGWREIKNLPAMRSTQRPMTPNSIPYRNKWSSQNGCRI